MTHGTALALYANVTGGLESHFRAHLILRARHHSFESGCTV
jgi:hypothetical protein